MARPEMIVFDLDYTLWPFWIDTHHDPPFTKDKIKNKIYDGRGNSVKCYPDVPSMLQDLHSDGYNIGIASRTTCGPEARELVQLFGWNHYIHFMEIFPECKISHFKRLCTASGIALQNMLFFDDEYRNIKDVRSIGVTCIHAENGMSDALLKDGLTTFANKK